MNKNTMYVELKRVTKVIKGATVLNDINLKLDKGKIYGFKGRNGSGKTMLFRAICGLIKLSDGEITIGNEKIGKNISFPSSVGVVIEYPGFLPQYTGFKNLKLLAAIQNKVSDDEISNAIEKVGLDPNDKRKFKKYSLGMKQRLGIAQAIMEDPELIILDEPTNALDEKGISLVRDILSDLRNKNKTILIASHDQTELEFLADEIFTIDAGSITNHEVKKGL
ncbi:ATP-binding cassette domain-containing protein [Bacillus manliponensis]|uniref:ATP-binding cassette domain-containing protein n=1 Tax=Bacillus manliponensis TaxID=574376 RepID=UPI00351811D0